MMTSHASQELAPTIPTGGVVNKDVLFKGLEIEALGAQSRHLNYFGHVKNYLTSKEILK